MDRYKSIVVLPFNNISSDPENEYFADGVTEELINALSKVEGLLVTARTSSFSYKHSKKDVRIIGNELGVSTALEGSIRKAGNRVRISTQLIRTDNGFQVWSDSFDRDLEDIFELQDEISLLIADKLRENFGHLEIGEHLVSKPTANLEAYTLYLKGRYYQLRWNFDEFDLAIEAYEQSIALDPNFHQPYYGLLQCYGLKASWGMMDKEEGLKMANHYLMAGLKVNAQTSEAYFALATKALWVDWKPKEAIKHLQQALQINPNDSESMESAAEAYIALGRFSEASGYIKRALEVNPISANHHFTMGNIHYLQGEYKEALGWFKNSLEIDPTWELSLQVSALCHILLGDKAALDDILKSNPNLTEPALFEPLYEAINKQVVLDLNSLAETREVYFPWKLWKQIYAGEEEQALANLVEGIEKRQGQYLNFLREPLNKPLTANAAIFQKLPTVFESELQAAEYPSPQQQKVVLPEADQKYFLGEMARLMEEEEIYRIENLSIRSLAEKLDLHPNKLSWLINENLGKNFNEYINGLRVKSFKEKAVLEEYAHFSILGLAFDCGFNSKSVFNDFFKKSEGSTPSAWLKAQKRA